MSDEVAQRPRITLNWQRSVQLEQNELTKKKLRSNDDSLAKNNHPVISGNAKEKTIRRVQHKHAASFWWHNMVSFIIFHQRSVKRFLVRLMIPPKGQMMMVQQLQLDLERL